MCGIDYFLPLKLRPYNYLFSEAYRQCAQLGYIPVTVRHNPYMQYRTNSQPAIPPSIDATSPNADASPSVLPQSSQTQVKRNGTGHEKDKERWNTGHVRALPSFLTPDSEVNRPEDVFPKEFSSKVDLDRLYAQHFLLQEQLGRVVSKDSPVLLKSGEIFCKLIVAAGLSLERVDLTLLRSPEENAYIFRGKEMSKAHLTLLTGLFETIEKRLGKLKEGHLAFILGHELGHLVEGDYDTARERNGEAPLSPDEPTPLNLTGIPPIKSLILGRLFGRDQETRADEHALRWMHQSGYPMSEGVEVLKLFVEMEAAQSKASTAAKPSGVRDSIEEIGVLLTRTHPASEARVMRALGKIKEIEIEEQISFKNKMAKNSAQVSLNDNEIAKTPLQRINQELTRILTGTKAVEEINTDGVAQLIESVTDLHELRQLSIFIPMWVSCLERVAPRMPYDGLSSNPLDNHHSHTRTIGSKFLKGVLDHCKYKAEALFDLEEKTLSEALEAREITQTEFSHKKTIAALKAWLSGPGVYGQESSLYNELLAGLTAKPELLIDLLKEFETVGIESEGLGKEWLKPLASSMDSEVSLRYYQLRSLLLSERVDCSNLLFKLIDEGILDSVNDRKVVGNIFRQASEIIGADNMDRGREFAKRLGEKFRFWMEVQGIDPATDQGRVVITECLRSVLSISEDAENPSPTWEEELSPKNYTALEIAALAVSDSSKLSLRGKIELSKELLPEGRIRDLLLFRILEDEAGFFREASSLLFQQMPYNFSFEIPNDAKFEKSTREYVFIFEQIAPHLSLKWFRASLKIADFSLDRSDASSNEAPFEFPRLGTEGENGLYSPVLCAFGLKRTLGFLGQLNTDENIARFYVRSYMELKLQIPAGDAEDGSDVEAFFRYGFDEFIAEATALGGRIFPGFSSDSAEYARLQLENRHSSRSLQRAQALNPLFQRPPESLEDILTIVTELPQGTLRNYVAMRSLSIQLQRLALQQSIKKFEEQAPQSKLSDLNFSSIISDLDRLGSELAALNISGCKDHEGQPDLSEDTIRDLLSALYFDHSIESEISGEVGGLIDRAYRLEVLDQVYNDYSKFISLRLGVTLPPERGKDLEITSLPLPAIAAKLGECAFNYLYSGENHSQYERLAPKEQLDKITGVFKVPCPEQDSKLLKVLRRVESDLTCDDAKTIYALLTESVDKTDLGRRIYNAEIAKNPNLLINFDQHLALILDTHPKESISRDQALRSLFEGNSKGAVAVTTWEQRERVLSALSSDTARTDLHGVIRSTALSVIQEAIRRDTVPAKEKVDTILWLAKLGGKPHLVECYELVEGGQVGNIQEQAAKLSDQEKKGLLRSILGGEAGILRTADITSRKRFLDTLFFSIFDKSKGGSPESLRYFKSVYDTMLAHVDPDRASTLLGNFLTAQLEGKSFNQQVKLFFESFGFVGIKTAQYLVSSTTLLPPEMKEALMDLTSRVEGPDKRLVFNLLEKTLGEEDARLCIKEVGDKLGGGSLMLFYEVTLWNKDRSEAGETIVVGILRPDIVNAMPEDLALVHRVIETMQEAPEIFGGKTVSMDLMENLLWQSLTETDLQRTVRIQKAMAKDIEDFNKRYSESRFKISVPKIKESLQLSINGENRTVKLCKGPLIFMQKAPGVTLDLFMKKCEAEGEAGRAKVKRVMEKLSTLFVEQLITYKRIHADLHPGNILVDDKDGELNVSILDVGLSAELDKELSEGARKILRIAVGVGNKRDEPVTGFRALRERFLKWSVDLDRVSEDEGMRWVKRFLSVIETTTEKNWDDTVKDEAAKRVWKALSDEKLEFQAKLTSVMEVINSLDLSLPREAYYIIRAAKIMAYIWKEVDWEKNWRTLKMLNNDTAHEKLPEWDQELVLNKCALIAQHLHLSFDREQAAQKLTMATKATQILEQLEGVYSAVKSGLSESGHPPNADTIDEFISILHTDPEIRTELKLDELGDRLKILEAKSRAEKERARGAFLDIQPLPEGEARRIATDNSFGMLPRVWRERIHSGTLVRVTTPSKTVSNYLVSLITPIHFELPELTPLRHTRLNHAEEEILINAGFLSKEAQVMMRDMSTRKDEGEVTDDEEDGDDEEIADSYKVSEAEGFLQLVREVGGEELTLGDLMRKNPRSLIEFFINNEWVLLQNLWIHPGETEEEYLRDLRQTISGH